MQSPGASTSQGRVALVAGSNRGHQTARKIAGGSNAPINAFDGREFPDHPLYNGDPSLFLPLIGAWYRTRDWIDRKRAA
jgi:hypothetical protein